MKSNLQVHIPKPCHEDWHKMTPTQQGRFCQSCAKQVVDFSLMTDQQILNYFANNSGKLCGRFAADQLQRPLQPVKQEKKKWWWVAAMMPVLLFFTKSSAQKKNTNTPHGENVIQMQRTTLLTGDIIIVSGYAATSDYDDPEVGILDNWMYKARFFAERPTGSKEVAISGKLVDAGTQLPIPFATVAVKDSKLAVLTNVDGNFKIKTQTTAKKVVLTISSIGFDTEDVRVSVRDTGQQPSKKNFIVKGRIIDEKGNVIPFATILLKGTRRGTISDKNGRFKMSLPASTPEKQLLVSCIGFEETEQYFSSEENKELLVKCRASNNMSLGIIVTTGSQVYQKKSEKKDTALTFIQRVFQPTLFKTYPNPAPRGSNVTIEITTAGKYSIQLFDNAGRLLTVQEFEAREGMMQTSISIPSSFAAGIYYVRLKSDDTKKQYTDKIMVQ